MEHEIPARQMQYNADYKETDQAIPERKRFLIMLKKNVVSWHNYYKRFEMEYICQQYLHTHCKKIRRFYGKIPGIWLSVHLPLFLRASTYRAFLEIKIW